MDCDRFEVLYRVVRIANSTAFDFPRSCKSILRFLGSCLKLESISLLLLDSRQKTFTRSIHHSGPDLFLFHQRPPEPGAETEALQGRQPIHRGDRWLFPVLQDRRAAGLLDLRLAPGTALPEEQVEVLQVVCEEFAHLAQTGRLRRQERRQLERLTLLSDLGRELHRVHKFEDLAGGALRILLQHGIGAGIALRPLLEDIAGPAAVLHRQPQVAGECDFFREIEEKHFQAAVRTGLPVVRRLSRPAADASGEPLAVALVSIPLVVEQRTLGVLSVFGNEDHDLLFTAGRDGRRFMATLGSHLAHALERVRSRELLESLSAENDRKLRETSLLYRISRAIHSTLRLNELMHLVLSAAVAPGGGGFERAMLFTVNERTQTLQGMLCVTRETSALVLPPEQGARGWERPVVSDAARQAQRESACCRKIMKQRLPLDPRENALARAIGRERVIFVSRPEKEPASGAALAEDLQLGPYACAPLLGRHRPLGVLLVDNPVSQEPLSTDRQRFLGLFANQAGSAMENSMLLHRLETAHQDLRETQERLIQGEKMAVLGEMAASIAHEMRNPLVPLGGFAQRLVRMFPEGSREAEYAEIIAREVRRMEEMLSNILAFSRKQMLCFTEGQVTEIVEEALDLEREALDRCSIEVVCEFADNLPWVQCDEKKLRQVLINLITNARQAMPDGGTLTVRTARSILRGNEAVSIEIEDSGGGISAEVLHNIFNPFFTTKEKGTGLGLSVSHRIIEHHRGEIEVKNRERGVVFSIRLPALLTSATNASNALDIR